jgi:folate-dependent tRNA-U54 methylase TrmFO/GidA
MARQFQPMTIKFGTVPQFNARRTKQRGQVALNIARISPVHGIDGVV